MNAFEGASQVIIVIQQAIPAVEKLWKLGRRLGLAMPRQERFSYENLSLQLTLDLKDPSGALATVHRSQRVKFLTDQDSVLRTPLWGEGNQLRRLEVKGATRLGVQTEGPRRVLFLGLAHAQHRGRVRDIKSTETLSNAFLNEREYFEAVVERPTKRLRLRVLFPGGRVPKQAYVAAGRREVGAAPIRLGADGRAVLTWSIGKPCLDRVYSLRWTW